MKFYPILVTDVVGFIDVLIRFCAPKVKFTARGGLNVDGSLSSSSEGSQPAKLFPQPAAFLQELISRPLEIGLMHKLVY